MTAAPTSSVVSRGSSVDTSKSMSQTARSLPTSTFEGFTSLWITAARCTRARARATCAPTWSASSTGSGPLATRCVSDAAPGSSSTSTSFEPARSRSRASTTPWPATRRVMSNSRRTCARRCREGTSSGEVFSTTRRPSLSLRAR